MFPTIINGSATFVVVVNFIDETFTYKIGKSEILTFVYVANIVIDKISKANK